MKTKQTPKIDKEIWIRNGFVYSYYDDATESRIYNLQHETEKDKKIRQRLLKKAKVH
jgi:hypothetical protein